MATIGEELKAQREQRGITLEQIADSTRIGLRHLRALESDRFELLPGGVFNRGICKNYLQFLEMEESPWLERFTAADHAASPQDDTSDWQKYAHRVTGLKTAPPGEEDVRFRWLGIAILFLVLAALAWFTWRVAANHWHRAPQATGTAHGALLYLPHGGTPAAASRQPHLAAPPAPPHLL